MAPSSNPGIVIMALRGFILGMQCPINLIFYKISTKLPIHVNITQSAINTNSNTKYIIHIDRYVLSISNDEHFKILLGMFCHVL